MKEHIQERSLLYAVIVTSVLARQEIYSDTRERTQERNLLNVNIVEDVLVLGVIFRDIKKQNIEERTVLTAISKIHCFVFIYLFLSGL